MNLVNKTKPWMMASLLAVSSAFGQQTCAAPKTGGSSCQNAPQQVCKPAKAAQCGVMQAPQMPMMAAYNAPGEINIGMEGEIDFFVTGSFVYWQPLQDNMDVALINNNPLANLLTTGSGFQGNYVDMDFQYKPGFKVALGMNLQHDDWTGYGEYTRFHSQHTASSNGSDIAGPSVYATQGHPMVLVATGQLFNSMSSTYNCNFDFVDGRMERVYYVGKNLMFHSAFGARGAFITQSLHVEYVNTTSVTTAGPAGLSVASTPGTTDVYARLHSWAVGPSAGVEMDWVFGDGVRFFGSSYADILYTKYKVQDKTASITALTVGSVTAGHPIAFVTKDKVAGLRTHLDFEFGFGWGMYLDNNAWHIDLSAAYDFQVFFDQNMFQHYEAAAVLGSHREANGNLYVQGLTATARIDF